MLMDGGLGFQMKTAQSITEDANNGAGSVNVTVDGHGQNTADVLGKTVACMAQNLDGLESFLERCAGVSAIGGENSGLKNVHSGVRRASFFLNQGLGLMRHRGLASAPDALSINKGLEVGICPLWTRTSGPPPAVAQESP